MSCEHFCKSLRGLTLGDRIRCQLEANPSLPVLMSLMEVTRTLGRVVRGASHAINARRPFPSLCRICQARSLRAHPEANVGLTVEKLATPIAFHLPPCVAYI